MGHGVFFDNEGLTFICDPFDGIEPDDDFEYKMAWDDFTANLAHSLPKGWNITHPNYAHHCKAGEEVASNGLYSLYVSQCESGNGNAYVTIRAREDVKEDYFCGYRNTINLAIANMHHSMNKIAKSATGYVGPLRRRTSAWTSGNFWDFEPVEFTASHL